MGFWHQFGFQTLLEASKKRICAKMVNFCGKANTKWFENQINFKIFFRIFLEGFFRSTAKIFSGRPENRFLAIENPQKNAKNKEHQGKRQKPQTK